MVKSAKEEFDAQVVLLCQWSRSIAMLPLPNLRSVIETTSEGPAAMFLLKLLDAADNVQDVILDNADLTNAHVNIPRKQPQPEATMQSKHFKKG